MKTFLLSLMLIFTASLASATGSDCKKKGNAWQCEVNNTTYIVSNAASAAEAHAAAVNYANQEQEQSQSQSSSNTNNNVASSSNRNSVNIEGNPKHTTSMSLGVGVNFNVPIASGVQTNNAIREADWWMQNGQPCVAYEVMLKAPRTRQLGIDGINCGDKG